MYNFSKITKNAKNRNPQSLALQGGSSGRFCPEILEAKVI